jgi:hypothetical protein
MRGREAREANETRERFQVNSRASFLFAFFAFSLFHADVSLFTWLDPVQTGKRQRSGLIALNQISFASSRSFRWNQASSIGRFFGLTICRVKVFREETR